MISEDSNGPNMLQCLLIGLTNSYFFKKGEEVPLMKFHGNNEQSGTIAMIEDNSK